MRNLAIALLLAAFPAFGADPAAARVALIRAADRALQTAPASVMDKKKTPPSRNKHDYMSVAPYWWPDPSKPDGLPYIRRDGETIPSRASDDYDRTSLGQMMNAVTTLGLAFRETSETKYADHAVKLMRVWFLDQATAMNPNLNYAQAIPGITEGRGTGMIDTAGLVGVVQTCQYLENSKTFTPPDRAGMKAWFAAYLKWAQTSKNGKEEAAAQNNHGTWYDVQAMAFALYSDQKDLARTFAEQAKTKRIAVQIEPDGKMPRELARTKSLSYSLMNLRGFFDLAGLASQTGVDLWSYQTPDGRSLRKALDYLAPYVDPSRPWPGQQIDGGVTPALRIELAVLLHRAALAYKEPLYGRMTSVVAGPAWDANRAHILWPASR